MDLKSGLVLGFHQTDCAIGLTQLGFFDFAGGGCFGITVISNHDTGALDAQLAHLALSNGLPVLIGDLDFPAIAGNTDGARLQNTKIDGQSLQAVHHQDADLLNLADSETQQQVGHAVGVFVENRPGDFAAMGYGGGGLNQLILLPGHALGLPKLGVDCDKGNLGSA